jgi:hypothetical protein
VRVYARGFRPLGEVYLSVMPTSARTDLEAQLEALTREFVANLIAAIQSASFGDVAALSSRRPEGRTRAPERRVKRAGVSGAQRRIDERASVAAHGRVRQTAARRAELSERVVKALQGAGSALGVRALSTALGVPPDSLAAPLRELRDKGIIHKHGDKRATTYSA